MSQRTRHTALIKSLAAELGFTACGIARARRLDEEASRLETWLQQGYHGSMAYMANHFDKRLNPCELVPGARSVISLLHNYYPQQAINPGKPYKLARYAYGKDYHKVVKKKLKQLFARLKEEAGDISGRYFVDSAPVMERQWARLAGLGWLGKNGLLLSKQKGSYFFLAELIVDLELDYDRPLPDHCGTCTRCLDACPTAAIVKPGVVDGSRCISYFTIELKATEQPPADLPPDGWIFGCDVCQEVCPWNRFATPHQEPAFQPKKALLEMTAEDWQQLTREQFTELFSGTAVMRTGFAGLKRNIARVNQHLEDTAEAGNKNSPTNK